MNKLYKDYKNQKKLLIEAIVKKDHMELYESITLKNDFVLKLGEPRYELHKLELAIVRTKLKLEMIQTCINFKLPLDTDYIDKQLEKEFENNDIMLKSMKREIDNVHTLKEVSKLLNRNAIEIKTLYFAIASYVHPELINKSDTSAKRLWSGAKKAYEKRDIEKLRKIKNKVLDKYKKTIENKNEEGIDIEKLVNELKLKTEDKLLEIESLKKKFPFNEANILEDEEAVSKFRQDIDVDIKVAKEVLNKLEKQVLEKLPAPNGYLN